MTVQELMQELKKYPQDAVVLSASTSSTLSEKVSVGFSDRYPEYLVGSKKVVFITAEEL